MFTSDEPIYVDSSVLLAVLLGHPQAETAARIWDGHPRRLTSILFEAECRTVLRRADRAGRLALGLPEFERDLSQALTQVSLHDLERGVLDRLASLPELGSCRTLDAVHLATAVLLRERLGTLLFATFDRDLARCARGLGFAVLDDNAG